MEPALSSASASLPIPHDGAVALLQGKRIVVVEDEGITQLQLRRSLTRLGLTVVGCANNGATGVEMVLQERPDLVLMDINLPEMDGLQATKRILAQNRTCIVMLTAYATGDYQQKAMEAGACGYILKPIVMDLLLQALARAWRQFSQ